jgi:hypothetical protein
MLLGTEIWICKLKDSYRIHLEYCKWEEGRELLKKMVKRWTKPCMHIWIIKEKGKKMVKIHHRKWKTNMYPNRYFGRINGEKIKHYLKRFSRIENESLNMGQDKICT